eukprot:g3812.t1
MADDDVPLVVFLIVICSAFVHASWNLATRAIKGDLAVLASSCCFGAILLSPALFFVSYDNNNLGMGILFGIISGIVHIVYVAFVGLMYAHTSGNISTVYPVARGSGVCLTAIFAGPVLGETISLLGFFGILTILLGIALMASAKFLQRKETTKTIIENSKTCTNPMTSETVNLPKENEKLEALPEENCFTKNRRFGAIFLSLILGCIISSYSLIDKVGVGYINPVAYIWIMEVTETCFFVPYFLLYEKNRNMLLKAFREKKKYIAIVSVFKSGCYLMVLYALTISKASYITALRECSVVFGAILGFIVLKESINYVMVFGILSIVAGLVMIKLA